MKKRSEPQKFLLRLGARIRALRLKKGWTLEETEDHGWPSWRHLQKIESGKNITVVTLWRVAMVLNVTVNDLVKDL